MRGEVRSFQAIAFGTRRSSALTPGQAASVVVRPAQVTTPTSCRKFSVPSDPAEEKILSGSCAMSAIYARFLRADFAKPTDARLQRRVRHPARRGVAAQTSTTQVTRTGRDSRTRIPDLSKREKGDPRRRAQLAGTSATYIAPIVPDEQTLLHHRAKRVPFRRDRVQPRRACGRQRRKAGAALAVIAQRGPGGDGELARGERAPRICDRRAVKPKGSEGCARCA